MLELTEAAGAANLGVLFCLHGDLVYGLGTVGLGATIGWVYA